MSWAYQVIIYSIQSSMEHWVIAW